MEWGRLVETSTDMRALIARIESLVVGLDGWCSPAKACTLASAVIALRPDTVVEIGVWGGRSFLPMAMAMREIGRGMAIGIDPWNPKASMIGQSQANREWWGNIDHEMVYGRFMKNVSELGLSNVVKICRAKSDEVEPPQSIGILHIDGNHGPQAEKDIQRFAPNVKAGGLLIMDDLNWEGGYVGRAYENAKRMGFEELYRIEMGSCLQRQ